MKGRYVGSLTAPYTSLSSLQSLHGLQFYHLDLCAAYKIVLEFWTYLTSRSLVFASQT